MAEKLKTLKLEHPILTIRNVEVRGELTRLIKIEGHVLLNDTIAFELSKCRAEKCLVINRLQSH
jgi:hypothetical protein